MFHLKVATLGLLIVEGLQGVDGVQIANAAIGIAEILCLAFTRVEFVEILF